MREPLTHRNLASMCADAIALSQSFGDDGDFTHSSNHVRDGPFHRVVVDQSTHYQQPDGHR